MRRVVNGGLVQKHHILARAAAADVVANKALARSAHARQKLDALDNIGLAEQRRNALNGGDLKFFHSHIGIHKVAVEFFALHINLRKLGCLLFKNEIDLYVAVEFHSFRLRRVAKEVGRHLVTAFGQRQTVEAVSVGDCSGAGFGHINSGANHLLARSGVGHRAADCVLALRCYVAREHLRQSGFCC